MVLPWLDAYLSIVCTDDPLASRNLDAELAFEHFLVLFLVRVEMQGRFLRREADELRVLEEECHFEAEGALGVRAQGGGYCAVEASEEGCERMEG